MTALQDNSAATENPIEISINLFDDALYASISISGHFDASDGVRNLVDEALHTQGITFGIRTEALDELCKKGVSVTNVIIAEGEHAKDGENATYKFNFDIEQHVSPKLNEDGSVDHKDMGFVASAKKDQILFEKTAATPGEAGINVLGNPIYPIPGKDYNVRTGKYCQLSEDGLAITASCDGAIVYENNTLSISPILEINEDVGNGTGNISFPGEVRVHGNVLAGMRIKCNSLVIDGLVENANLVVSGDVTINNGIQGNGEAHITCAGNLKCLYINSAIIYAGGSIAADMIINSQVKTERNLTLSGKKGHIIGGKTTVKGRFSAQTVGSDLGVITEFVIGESSVILEAIQTKQREIEELDLLYAKTRQALDLLKVKLTQMPNHEKYKSLNREYTKNLINTQHLNNKKHEELLRLQNKYTEASVNEFAAGLVHPGTVIYMNDQQIYIAETRNNCLIKSVRGEIFDTFTKADSTEA